MTNTRDNFSGGGGDVAPSPRSPASSGDGKKTQRTASVPIASVPIQGVIPWLTESAPGKETDPQFCDQSRIAESSSFKITRSLGAAFELLLIEIGGLLQHDGRLG